MAGVELRIVDDDGTVLPWDGECVGEIEVRGPWVTGAYHLRRRTRRSSPTAGCAPATSRPSSRNGFVQITDRSKDVIKSGGEWISSVELENALMGHPAVFEAAVVAVPDERWDERPLACVVLRRRGSASPAELREFLVRQGRPWWLPERWTFIEAVPKTSVGKFDKKVLRKQYADGELEVQSLAPATAQA